MSLRSQHNVFLLPRHQHHSALSTQRFCVPSAENLFDVPTKQKGGGGRRGRGTRGPGGRRQVGEGGGERVEDGRGRGRNHGGRRGIKGNQGPPSGTKGYQGGNGDYGRPRGPLGRDPRAIKAVAKRDQSGARRITGVPKAIKGEL